MNVFQSGMNSFQSFSQQFSIISIKNEFIPGWNEFIPHKTFKRHNSPFFLSTAAATWKLKIMLPDPFPTLKVLFFDTIHDPKF